MMSDTYTLDSKNTWCIPSNDGWNNICFVVNEKITINGRAILRCKVIIKGNYWDRKSLQLSQKNDWILIQDHLLELPQLFIDMNSLDKLLMDYQSWRNIDDVINLQLSGLEEQSVRIIIGHREGVITSTYKPALTFICEMARINVEIYFIVDATCISIASQQLQKCISIYS